MSSSSFVWLIYFASVVGSVTLVLGWLAFILSCCGFGFGHIARYIASAFASSEPDQGWESWVQFWRMFKWMLPVGLICGFMSALLPTSNSIYAIGAVRATELVVTNEAVVGIASDASKALHQWIQKQLKEAK